MSEEQILALLRTAVVDDVVYCIYCGESPLEPDYNTCISCGRKNPLKENGLI